MIQIIFYIISLISQYSSPEKIRTGNRLLERFEEYYSTKQYEQAVSSYELLKGLEIQLSQTTKFNAGQSYFQIGDTLNSKTIFEETIAADNPIISSRAFNMLALLELQKKDTLHAIAILEKGILQNNANTDLLFNYELLKKKFKNNNPQLPQSNGGNKKQEEEKNGYAAKTNEKIDELNSTTPPKIEREQALQILEALKAKEIYFIPKNNNEKIDSANYGKW